MSSDLAIRVSGVSKCYNIYESPMHRLVQSFYPRAARVIGSVGAQWERKSEGKRFMAAARPQGAIGSSVAANIMPHRCLINGRKQN